MGPITVTTSTPVSYIKCLQYWNFVKLDAIKLSEYSGGVVVLYYAYETIELRLCIQKVSQVKEIILELCVQNMLTSGPKMLMIL